MSNVTFIDAKHRICLGCRCPLSLDSGSKTWTWRQGTTTRLDAQDCKDASYLSGEWFLIERCCWQFITQRLKEIPEPELLNRLEILHQSLCDWRYVPGSRTCGLQGGIAEEGFLNLPEVCKKEGETLPPEILHTNDLQPELQAQIFSLAYPHGLTKLWALYEIKNAAASRDLRGSVQQDRVGDCIISRCQLLGQTFIKDITPVADASLEGTSYVLSFSSRGLVDVQVKTEPVNGLKSTGTDVARREKLWFQASTFEKLHLLSKKVSASCSSCDCTDQQTQGHFLGPVAGEKLSQMVLWNVKEPPDLLRINCFGLPFERPARVPNRMRYLSIPMRALGISVACCGMEISAIHVHNKSCDDYGNFYTRLLEGASDETSMTWLYLPLADGEELIEVFVRSLWTLDQQLHLSTSLLVSSSCYTLPTNSF